MNLLKKEMENRILYFRVFIITLISGLSACQQTTSNEHSKKYPSNFSIVLSTYNHAELLFEGITSYKINHNILTVSNKSTLSQKDTVLYVENLSANQIIDIELIRLDTLSEMYNNNCVMPTSGSEFEISILKDGKTENINLHHYYHKQVEQLIIELNKLLPEIYTIQYLTNNTKQDCQK